MLSEKPPRVGVYPPPGDVLFLLVNGDCMPSDFDPDVSLKPFPKT